MNITNVFVDKLEYSRYYRELATISSTVEVNSPTDGAQLTVSLIRLDGYGAVAVKTITTAASTAKYLMQFDLTKDPFTKMTMDTDVGLPRFAAPYYLAKAGDYVVQVTDELGNYVQSGVFAVSIVPVKEIKSEWAKGVTFYDYEILKPRVQPQAVTGVTITEVTADHFKGVFQLTYTASTKSLSWNNGRDVPVVGDSPTDLILLDEQQQDYIMVNVTPLSLPSSDVTENIVIDNGRIDDWDIIRQVRRAGNWVQQQIVAKIEPNLVDTNPGTNYCDEVAVPETYYRPRNYNKWLSFKLPYTNILDIESITGYFNQSQVSTVPRSWFVWDEKTGITELVPSSATQVIWSFYNGIFVMSFLFNYASIPSFWHYRLWTGLRDLFNEREVVREAVAKKAVIELLNTAGTAYRAGYASQSTGRDGVSEGESYTSSAMYGTFGGHITLYENWLKREIPRMKKRFTGIQFTSI